MPNVLATVALFATLSGTAYAAIVVTGANVRNGTIEGRDVKNLSLASTDFSRTAVTALRVRGNEGPIGDVGPTGSAGRTGSKGIAGVNGTDAPRAYTFLTSKQHSRLVDGTSNSPTALNANSDCLGWADDPAGCTGVGSGSPIRYPRWNFRCQFQGAPASRHCLVGQTSAPQLTRSMQPVMVSSNQAGGGLLELPYDGTIVLNASGTFYTQLTPVMQRVECQLEVARVENNVPQAPISVGAPMSTTRFMSASDANQRQRLVTIALTGATAQPAGTYETQLSCRSPDDTGQSGNRLEFIEGNLSVLSTRTNGNG